MTDEILTLEQFEEVCSELSSRPFRVHIAESLAIEIAASHPEFRRTLARNKTISEAVIRELSADEDPEVRKRIAEKRATPEDIQIRLARDSDERVRVTVCRNPKVPKEALEILAADPQDWIRERAEDKLRGDGRRTAREIWTVEGESETDERPASSENQSDFKGLPTTEALDFNELWLRYYPGLPPLAHVLRERRGGTWWRFHSLPKSKQYPETSEEREILLHRHNTVATDVLGLGQECWFVQALYTDEPFEPPAAVHVIMEDEGAEWRPVLSEMLSDLDFDSVGLDPELPLHGAAFRTRWKPGKFDALIKHVALGSGPCLIVGTRQGQIYAPYAGGADLLVETKKEREYMKNVYEEWLSSHPAGL